MCCTQIGIGSGIVALVEVAEFETGVDVLILTLPLVPPDELLCHCCGIVLTLVPGAEVFGALDGTVALDDEVPYLLAEGGNINTSFVHIPAGEIGDMLVVVASVL